MTHVVAVVPAYNQIQSIAATVKALLELEELGEVVVVDDGSKDGTAEAAREAGARVIALPKNLGKGGAVSKAIGASGAPDGYLLIDADLSSSASHAKALLEMLTSDAADMIVSVFPKAGRSRGYGIVKRMANRILMSATGRSFEEPLSGQRAVKGPLLRSLNLASGFGLEIGMTLHVAAKNARTNAIEEGKKLAEVTKLPSTGTETTAFEDRKLPVIEIYRRPRVQVFRRRDGDFEGE